MPVRPFDFEDFEGNTDPKDSQSDATSSANSQSAITASQAASIDLPKGLSDMHTGAYRPALFREQETINLITILSKKDKANALLIGKAGSGKTAIVRNLAKLIDAKDNILPDRIKKMHLFELSLNALNAGNILSGQSEKAIQEVIDFATDPDNHAIIFIDEVHQLFDDQDPQMSKFAQALKPAMARDNFHFIGATTIGESKTVLRDPAIARRVEEARLHDLTIDETKKIVLNALPAYRDFHQVIVDDSLADDIIKLADRHYTNTSRPDNALSLTDQACAYKAIEYHQDTANLSASVIASLPDSQKTVTEKTLSETIERHTGVNGTISPRNLENTLLGQVKGQDEAISDIAKRITLFKSNILPSKAPLSFLLAGPTGNGKTETAKAITRALFRDEKRMITINMTEFTNESSINQLIGSPDGYVGSDSKRVTPFDNIYDNPSQVLLLDEFEKADQSIHHLFYQILEEGFIEDRRGRHIDFSKAILIFTSNAETSAPRAMGFAPQSNDESSLVEALSNEIPDALLNRMTKIYKYNAISEKQYGDILSLVFDKTVQSVKENQPNMTIEPERLSDDLLEEWVKESYNPKLNGRPARNFVRSKFESATLDAILNNTNQIKIN